MQLYRGKFQENGSCGYLLKPLALRDPTLKFHPVEGPFPSSVTLTLTIISAQQLPKPGSAKGEVIDPYVYLQLFGVPGEVKTETTRCVHDNGFNPYWDETFTFVSYPTFPTTTLSRSHTRIPSMLSHGRVPCA